MTGERKCEGIFPQERVELERAAAPSKPAVDALVRLSQIRSELLDRLPVVAGTLTNGKGQRVW